MKVFIGLFDKLKVFKGFHAKYRFLKVSLGGLNSIQPFEEREDNSFNPMHSKRPKLHTILAFLSAIGLRVERFCLDGFFQGKPTGILKMLFPFVKIAGVLYSYT